MQPIKDLRPVWRDLAVLIKSLSPEEQIRYQSAIRMLVHDLRQSIAIIHGVEILLRRGIPATEDNVELLESLRSANQRAIGLITEFAQPFDSDIVFPNESYPVHQD